MACLLGAARCLVRGRDDDAPAWDAPLAGALAVAAGHQAVVRGRRRCGRARGEPRPRALAGAAAAAAALGAIDLLAFGGALPAIEPVGARDPLSLPNLLGLAAGHGGADAVRIAGAGLVAVAVTATVAVGRRRGRAGRPRGVLFCTVLTLAWVMPWYLVWALPFLALARPRAVIPLRSWRRAG